MMALMALERFKRVRAEWQVITSRPAIDRVRFEQVKAEAEALGAAGAWASGPADLLGVIRRERDELLHSRVIAWLLVPTHRHGLGRSALAAFLDTLWPSEELLRTGPVVVELEVPAQGFDDTGTLRDARADIVVRGDQLTVVIENKLDAGEQPQQCERQYWAFSGYPGDTRWVFLTPSGRDPQTAVSDAARAAWRTMSYAKLLEVISSAVASAPAAPSTGRATVMQYIETLSRHVVPPT
jgi:hypothetical protein